MRHTWKETWSGLRRNASMTIAVIVTMWVSLALFGTGLLATQQVEKFKGHWYDKIEVTVYLCNTESKGAGCDAGQDVTDAEKKAVEQTLRQNPNVAEVYYESKADAYTEFQSVYKNSPLADTLTKEQMPESYRVKLKDAEQYQSVADSVAGLRGVDFVMDLHKILDPLFRWLNLAKWATIAASILLLVAAALQITNTIQMAAHARRRELGIMRLVGASNTYIMMPFLLESLFAGVLGILLASATLAGTVYFVIVRKAQVSLNGLGAWIGWPETWVAVGGVAIVGILLSIVPTLLATRKYLRV
ncbi:MAG: permease-like cell division protein FtsX [Propionibacteriaceae bacterium]